MKPPIPAVFTALLCFALAACGPATIKAPDPNPVGEWQWSNDVLGSWRLEIKADGTFQREMTTPFDRKGRRISGRWSLTVTPSDPSWLERHGIFQKPGADDDLSRIAGVDPARKTLQWSAPGSITFLYTAPPGTELAPGAVWTGTTSPSASANTAPEMGIEERHPVRTHTDTSGEMFLDLAGKVFRTSATAQGAKTPAGQNEKVAGKIPDILVGKAPAPRPEKLEYLTVEPFTGIMLDLPSTWQGMDLNDAKKPPVSVASMAGKPERPKANSSCRFVPPEDVPDVSIWVSVQPVMFSAKQLTDSSQIDLDRFAAGFVKGASKALEEKGYHLEPNVTTDLASVGKRSVILCLAKMVDPIGNRRQIRAFVIPTESATILVECCWDAEPGSPWKAIIERACSSLKVADDFNVPETPKLSPR